MSAVAEGLTTNRRRYFVQGVSCLIGRERLPVVNLSSRGLFACSANPPRPGEDLELELTLPAEAPIKTHATVRWINDGASTKDGRLPMGYGVELTALDAPAQSAIRDFLKRADPIQGPPASW